MINPLGSKLVTASQIEISEHITHDILKTLMLRPPLLRDARDLTEEAIKLAVLHSPPIIYEKNNDNRGKKYICVGNFRSLELARPDVLELISTKCQFKKSFLEAIGLNRRKY